MPTALATTHSVLPQDGSAPEWIQLLPAGTFTAQDGRGPFRVRDAQAVISASMSAGRLPLDVNHATDKAMVTGQDSPAHAWIVELTVRDGEIWARLDWNPSGRELMANRSYRGISPVMDVSKDGTVVRVLRAALTNTPALAGKISALFSTGPEMDIAQLRLALGLAETADEATVLATVRTNASAVAAHATQLSAIAAAAGVTLLNGAPVTVDAITAALNTHKTSTVGEVVTLQTQLSELRLGMARDKAVAFVDAAIKAGKPIAVQLVREHYIKQHMADPAGTEVVLNALPSINAGGVVVERMVSEDGSDPLTKTEMTICKQMGLDPKKFAENKKRQRGASDGNEA